jgi:hypothetical protein
MKKNPFHAFCTLHSKKNVFAIGWLLLYNPRLLGQCDKVGTADTNVNIQQPVKKRAAI